MYHVATDIIIVCYTSYVLVFTARCTLVQSVVLRLHVVRLSVRPSVRLLIRNRSPLKISGKVAVGVVRDPDIFQGIHIRAHRAVIFAIAQLSCC